MAEMINMETDEFYADPQFALDAIVWASNNDRIAVIETKHAVTGETVRVLVGLREEEDGTAYFPLALLFDSSPFDGILLPPDGAFEAQGPNHEPVRKDN